MGELFNAARAGGAEAIEEVHRLVRVFARQICRGGGPPGAPGVDWEDVAQEAGRKLLALGLGQFRGDGSERSYLYSVVKATVLEMARSAARRLRREDRAASISPVRPFDPGARLDVQSILAALGPPCRDIIERVLLRDEPYAAVAQDLGLAESSVRARLSRCLRRAREMVSQDRNS